MKVIDASLEGVRIIEPERFEDDRGWFMELWNEDRYRQAGLVATFEQANISYSRRGVLRGMHYQTPDAQGKLVSVLDGAIFDAVIDVRRGSPAFGRWYGCELSRENRRQLWVPEGFAHGFLTISDHALVHYNCTVAYDPASDRSLAWDDPEVRIEWPEMPAILSQKDRLAPTLAGTAAELLPP